MADFSFSIDGQCNNARAGTIKTPHGEIKTPIFMPVGTQASVKALAPDDLDRCQASIILSNTYHLMLRPGDKVVQQMGGLHHFMSWNKPILTDSGGFQVFSLAGNASKTASKDGVRDLVKIDDDGVTFKSYLNGSSYRVTPESCMQIQSNLGADFIMAFDQCPPGQSTRKDVLHAMKKTTSWLKRCNTSLRNEKSRLIGIVQGGIYEDLRQIHAKEVLETELFAYAVGGLSVGEQKKDMWPACAAATEILPFNKPRYLMGVGTPEDLLDGVFYGIDMFDCVMPTRNARNGTLFTKQGKVSIKKACFTKDPEPVDETCRCYTCTNFSRAYLRHLYMSHELLFNRLASLHNITHYIDLMNEIRHAIQSQTFDSFRKSRKIAYLSNKV